MSCSAAFKAFIGFLLPMTFAWKLVAGLGDPHEIPKTIVQFLRHRGFETVKTEEVMDGMWVVRAQQRDCRLLVVEVSSKGWTRDVIRTFADTSDQLFLVVQGTVYEFDSNWLTVSNDIYIRVLRKIGLARSAPLLGVAASAACAADRLPWNEL